MPGRAVAQPPAAAVAAPPSPSIFAKIAAGYTHTCAITDTGGVKCWGDNQYGQLGDGTATKRNVPVPVSGLASGVTALAAGYGHTCALMAADGVKCWGANWRGQLGDGTTTWRNTPVDVNGLASGVTALVTGWQHTCALTATGGVKCWGENYYGQIGDGTTTDRYTPVDVVGLMSGVTALAAGYGHTCALTAAGGVKCWGQNEYGQLGDGTNTDHRTPVDVSGLAGGVTALAAGAVHTCALTAVGGVMCWGRNWQGQLGDGTTTDRWTPVEVTGLATGAMTLSAGGFHNCVVTATRLGGKCWGANWDGQLGDGTNTQRDTPVDVIGLESGVAALTAGDAHTCALTVAGRAKCWGDNYSGQLGDGTTYQSNIPMNVNGLTSGVTALAAGYEHTCAVTAAGGGKCWGANDFGQLGDGTTTWRSTPVDVGELMSGITAIVVGYGHTCALTSVGGVKCWGANGSGQLGDGTTADRNIPVDVIGLVSGVTALAVGGSHTCALISEGGVKCWGDNGSGQLGDGTTTDRNTPVDVSGLASGVMAVATGYGHTCTVMATGGAKCWGKNYSGQLGDGTNYNRRTPMDVIGLASGVMAMAAGYGHTCALTTGGGVKCWGENGAGQLGDGTTNDRNTPVDVSGLTSEVTAIAAGAAHACAMTTVGRIECWGMNYSGQLGDGTTINQNIPVIVSGLASGAAILTVGWTHTCAVVAGGRPKCWGWDGAGQLGLRTYTYRLTPVDVVEDAARVTLSYADGSLGSYFSVTGENFPASEVMTVTVNNQVLTNTLTVNETGGFIFFLSTDGADTGFYHVTVSVGNTSATMPLLLDEQAPLRAQEGGGVTLALPAGIGIEPKVIYLPVIQR